MYVKYRKDIFENSKLMEQEFIFPVMTFLSKYSATANMINTTIGCILFEFGINPISRNVDKTKSCLIALADNNIIQLHTELDKLNTPTVLSVSEYSSWVALHDFEIETINNLVRDNLISYKIGDVFMAIKFKAHNHNKLLENINDYGSTTYGYQKLMNWAGITNQGSMSKYVKLLSKTDILKVDKTEVIDKDKKLFKTTHIYSFKKLE